MSFEHSSVKQFLLPSSIRTLLRFSAGQFYLCCLPVNICTKNYHSGKRRPTHTRSFVIRRMYINLGSGDVSPKQLGKLVLSYSLAISFAYHL